MEILFFNPKLFCWWEWLFSKTLYTYTFFGNKSFASWWYIFFFVVIRTLLQNSLFLSSIFSAASFQFRSSRIFSLAFRKSFLTPPFNITLAYPAAFCSLDFLSTIEFCLLHAWLAHSNLPRFISFTIFGLLKISSWLCIFVHSWISWSYTILYTFGT